jgi:hypothetical protein
MKTKMPPVAVAVVFAAAVISACGGSSGGSTPSTTAQGTADGPCSSDMTCNAGLVCVSNLCVDLGSGAGGSGGDVGTAGGGGSSAASSGGPSFELDNNYDFAHSGGLYPTHYTYVKNIGDSGTTTVEVTYQNQTETNTFSVETGVQYVLVSVFPMSSGTTFNCALTVKFPGLVRNETTGTPPAGCAKIGGPSASELVPRSSCTCSGGCSGGSSTNIVFCFDNCGLAASNCCGGCIPAGVTCNANSCGG